MKGLLLQRERYNHLWNLSIPDVDCFWVWMPALKENGASYKADSQNLLIKDIAYSTLMVFNIHAEQVSEGRPQLGAGTLCSPCES